MAEPQWLDIATSDKYKQLSPDDRVAVKQDFFDRVVAPKVDADHQPALRADFLSRNQQFDYAGIPPEQAAKANAIKAGVADGTMDRQQGLDALTRVVKLPNADAFLASDHTLTEKKAGFWESARDSAASAVHSGIAHAADIAAGAANMGLSPAIFGGKDNTGEIEDFADKQRQMAREQETQPGVEPSTAGQVTGGVVGGLADPFGGALNRTQKAASQPDATPFQLGMQTVLGATQNAAAFALPEIGGNVGNAVLGGAGKGVVRQTLNRAAGGVAVTGAGQTALQAGANAVSPESMQEEITPQTIGQNAAMGLLGALPGSKTADHTLPFNSVVKKFKLDNVNGEVVMPSGDVVKAKDWREAKPEQRQEWLVKQEHVPEEPLDAEPEVQPPEHPEDARIAQLQAQADKSTSTLSKNIYQAQIKKAEAAKQGRLQAEAREAEAKKLEEDAGAAADAGNLEARQQMLATAEKLRKGNPATPAEVSGAEGMEASHVVPEENITTQHEEVPAPGKPEALPTKATVVKPEEITLEDDQPHDLAEASKGLEAQDLTDQQQAKTLETKPETPPEPAPLLDKEGNKYTQPTPLTVFGKDFVVATGEDGHAAIIDPDTGHVMTAAKSKTEAVAQLARKAKAMGSIKFGRELAKNPLLSQDEISLKHFGEKSGWEFPGAKTDVEARAEANAAKPQETSGIAPGEIKDNLAGDNTVAEPPVEASNASTNKGVTEDAITTRKVEGSGQEELRGVRQGEDLRQNEGQVRERQGEQAAGGGGAEPGAEISQQGKTNAAEGQEEEVKGKVKKSLYSGQEVAKSGELAHLPPQTTGEGLVAHLYKGGKLSAEHKTILTRLRGLVRDTEVHVIGPGEEGRIPASIRGEFDANTAGMVSPRVGKPPLLYLKKGAADNITAVHELIHAATMQAVDSVKNTEIVSRITGLRDAVGKGMQALVDSGRMSEKDMKAWQKVLKDNDELLGYSFSSPELRKILSGITEDGKMGKQPDDSVLAKIWQVVKELVGRVTGKPGDKSLYDALDKHFDSLLKSDAAKGYGVGVAGKVRKGAGAEGGDVSGTGKVGKQEKSATSANEPGEISNNPKFKAWFGDSKVVDAEGKPLVLYRGAADPFEESRMTGPTFFGDKEMAESYARERGEGNPDGGENLTPVYLAIKNPATEEVVESVASTLPNFEDHSGEGAFAYLDKAFGGEKHENFVDALVSKLQKQGYDGALIESDYHAGADRMASSYVAFKPEQVKSAVGNSGEFDPANPKIHKQTVAGEARPTGIANKVVDKERERFGFPEVEKEARRSFEKVWDETEPQGPQDYIHQNALITELENKPRAVTDTEDALLLRRQIELQTEHRAMSWKWKQAYDMKHGGAMAELRPQMARVRDELLKLYNINKAVGRETARGLAARRMLAHEDFTLAAMETRMAAAKGRALSQEELKQVEEMSKRVEKAEKALDQYKSALGKAFDRSKSKQQFLADTIASFKRTGKSPYRLMEALPDIDPKEFTTAWKRVQRMRPDLHLKDIDPGKVSKQVKAGVPITMETMHLHANLAKAQIEATQAESKMAGNHTSTREYLAKVRVAEVISSPLVFGKLLCAAAWRVASTPVEESIGAALRQVPVIREVAAKAPRHGTSSVAAEAKALSAIVNEGIRGAGQVLSRTTKVGKDGELVKTYSPRGSSDLDIVSGKLPEFESQTPLDWVGATHQALKTPIQYAEYARSLENRMQSAINAGVDVTDPTVLDSVAMNAYRDSQRAIFKQNNRLVEWYQGQLGRLVAPDKKTGRVPLGNQALWLGAKWTLPVVRIPTNIATEALDYVFGIPKGLSGIGKLFHPNPANATKVSDFFREGIKQLEPEAADAIMRSLKKGSLGATAMLMGIMAPNQFGGLWGAVAKPTPGTPKWGGLTVAGHNIPEWMLHSPLMSAAQFGASFAKAAESRYNGEPSGYPRAMLAATLGLVDEASIINQIGNLGKFFDAGNRNKAVDQFLASLIMPQVSAGVAKQLDRDADGRLIVRNPKGLWQTVQSGVPGHGIPAIGVKGRQDLPEKPVEREHDLLSPLFEKH